MKLIFNAGYLPLGFTASGLCANIKKSGKKDLALFYSEAPCLSGGLFTTNKIKAAPVEISRRHIKNGKSRAIIVNSGNANCMTGKQGLKDAEEAAQCVADELDVGKKEVLVSSTGIIGAPLPIKKIKRAIPRLVAQLSPRGFSDAAQAIMTTDTFAKEVFAKFKIGGIEIAISGVAKGAGMMAPQMKSATMLAFVFTDAAIAKPALDQALKEAINSSFNVITVDGCMSTNDTVFLLANGESGNRLIQKGSKEARIFGSVLKDMCLALAKMIVQDAEGATKFIEIRVRGVQNGTEAKKLAFSVANSNLFKCAMFGNDPNWGRIAAALGSVTSHLRWEKLDIILNNRAVFKNGKPCTILDNKFLKKRLVVVEIDLHLGKAGQTVYTSDLSYDYVRINADYN